MFWVIRNLHSFAVIFADIFIEQGLLGWQNIPIFMQIKLFAL